MTKTPLILLAGPTAVGKTESSIALAKALNGEIISADSMQVYRGLDVGSAKITREEMQGVPHHLIDILDPREEFHVMAFQNLARNAIEEIQSRGKVPVVTGGTGFYIQALLYGVEFSSDVDQEYRDSLWALHDEKGPEVLHQMLSEVDPDTAENLSPNNVKRVIRSLEFYHVNHMPISEHNRIERERTSPYEFRYFVLTMDREKLYERIDLRVDLMMKAGLLEEVKKLKENGSVPEDTAMQGIGYKEILHHLNDPEGYPLDQAVDDIKKNTRHFAKRQLTWFRREKEVIWVDKDKFSDQNELIQYLIGESKKIL